MSAVLETLARSLEKLLEDDPRVVVLGEDILQGGMLGLTRKIAEGPLRPRLLSCPLTTTSTLAHAGGLALGGQSPVVLLSGPQDLLEGLAGLREISRYGWRSDDRRRVPMVCLVPYGPGFGLGADLDASVEATLCAIPEICTLTLGRPEDSASMLSSALCEAERREAPVALLVPRALLMAETESNPGDPLSTLQVHHYGEDATVFCWGNTVQSTLEAAQTLSETGLSPTVIELHHLQPLDRDAILSHAQRTGKIVIAHCGSQHGGVASELAAIFADEAILSLDAPVKRVGGFSSPQSAQHEFDTLPSAQAIGEAIQNAVHY